MQFLLIVFDLGVVHKLYRLREEGVDSPKMLIFVNDHKVENVNRGG